MERHVAHPVLVRVFTGQRVEPDDEMAVLHLPGCSLCWNLAIRVSAELKEEKRLAPSTAAAKEILELLERKQDQALRWLLVRSRRAELVGLPDHEQHGRITVVPGLRTLEMFSALAEEAAITSREDPHLGEEAAFLAHALARDLPGDVYSEPLRNDLQAEALMVIANCRRLAGDWREAATACTTARNHLLRGSGRPAREARLLSIQASLAMDTGHLEQALELLRSAFEFCNKAQDPEAARAVAVQEANTLMAACRYEEAVVRAEETMSELTPKDARLEMLARNVITASLVFLGRPDEALQSFRATQPLYRQLRGRNTDLQVGYLEALLLDSQGHFREAEKAFRHNIAGYMEAELYKTAFLHLVTFLQSLIRREAFDKAARACEEALEMIGRAGSACHSQMIELWRSLLDLINARRLTDYQVLAARQYLVRHWNAPARHAPLALRVASSPRAVEVPRSESSSSIYSLPPKGVKEPVERTGPAASYDEAWERYDRALLAAALERCGGSIRKATTLLGISRNTLRERMGRYGLGAGEPCAAPEAGPGPELQDEEIQALDRALRARAWWSELKSLSPRQRLDRLQSISSLQTREMFDVMLDEASTVAPDDPLRGEETALLAQTLAGLLPRRAAPAEVRMENDLQAAALLALADCRRLAGDGEGAAAALEAARCHLAQGSRERLHEARFLAAQAALLAETGPIEPALTLFARAAGLYRRGEDKAAEAEVTIQSAGALRAARQYKPAIHRAEAALRRLPPGELRLELAARSLIIESLILLGRTDEALHSLFATLPLYKELRSRRTELQLGDLEALLLEALGYVKEAGAAFRNNLERRLDAGLFRDAFLTVLTRIEILRGRGDHGRAAGVCEEALVRFEESGPDGHATVRKLWQALRGLVEERALTEIHLLEARRFFVRWGALAVHRPTLQPGVLRLPAWVPGSETREPAASATEAPAEAALQPARRGLALLEPPDPAESLDKLGYKGALEQYSRQIVAAVLAQSQGSLGEASLRLGLSPKALLAKLGGGLAGEEG